MIYWPSPRFSFILVQTMKRLCSFVLLNKVFYKDVKKKQKGRGEGGRSS